MQLNVLYFFIFSDIVLLTVVLSDEVGHQSVLKEQGFIFKTYEVIMELPPKNSNKKILQQTYNLTYFVFYICSAHSFLLVLQSLGELMLH